MKCPHCKKPINLSRRFSVIPEIVKDSVIELSIGGYSSRQIAAMLDISFSAAAKIVREHRKEIQKPDV